MIGEMRCAAFMLRLVISKHQYSREFTVCRENVGWASTCNAMGQTAGYFLGNVVFLALESPDFCNNYLRSEPQSTGLVTIQGMSLHLSYSFFLVDER